MRELICMRSNITAKSFSTTTLWNVTGKLTNSMVHKWCYCLPCKSEIFPSGLSRVLLVCAHYFLLLKNDKCLMFHVYRQLLETYKELVMIIIIVTEFNKEEPWRWIIKGHGIIHCGLKPGMTMWTIKFVFCWLGNTCIKTLSSLCETRHRNINYTIPLNFGRYLVISSCMPWLFSSLGIACT